MHGIGDNDVVADGLHVEGRKIVGELTIDERCVFMVTGMSSIQVNDVK